MTTPRWMRHAALVADALANSGRGASTTGWIRINCPLCIEVEGSPDLGAALGVNAESGGYKCFRCRSKGRARGFAPSALREEARAPEADVKLPRLYTPLWDAYGSTATTTRRARNYLEGRNVSKRAIREARVGYCVMRGPRVAVPVIDSSYRMRGWVARTLGEDSPRYLNSAGSWASECAFNEAALLRVTREPALVVEGIFDALPYWPHAVAVLGKPTSAQVDVLATARRPLAICLDGDAADEGWALSRRLNLAGVPAGVVRLPPKTDPATVDRQWLTEAARAAVGE